MSLSELSSGLKVADQIQSGTSSGAKDGALEPELLLINEGFSPILAKIIQEVEKGEYVDLKELPPQKPVMEDNTLVELENGVVVPASAKQARSQKKPIQDLATWVQAFMAFLAIRNRKFPEAMNDLLAYRALITRDYQGLGWLSYNFQFRRLAATRGSGL